MEFRKYLFIMDFDIGTLLCCNLGDPFSDAAHFECSCGPQAVAQLEIWARGGAKLSWRGPLAKTQIKVMKW